MERRVATLARKLDNLVQRRGSEILHAALPPRYDVVLTVRLTDKQVEIYNAALSRTGSRQIFAFQHTLRRIFDHPAMLLLHHSLAGKSGRGKGRSAGQFFDGYDDVEPAKLGRDSIYPEMPTLPTELERITRSINDVLETVAALPLAETIDEMRGPIQSVQAPVRPPQLGLIPVYGE